MHNATYAQENRWGSDGFPRKRDNGMRPLGTSGHEHDSRVHDIEWWQDQRLAMARVVSGGISNAAMVTAARAMHSNAALYTSLATSNTIFPSFDMYSRLASDTSGEIGYPSASLYATHATVFPSATLYSTMATEMTGNTSQAPAAAVMYSMLNTNDFSYPSAAMYSSTTTTDSYYPSDSTIINPTVLESNK